MLIASRSTLNGSLDFYGSSSFVVRKPNRICQHNDGHHKNVHKNMEEEKEEVEEEEEEEEELEGVEAIS